MSQKKNGIPSVSTETKDYLVSTDNLANGNVPTYWGPNQETSEAYVTPSDYKTKRLINLEEVVRFIYNGEAYDYTSTTVDPCQCFANLVSFQDPIFGTDPIFYQQGIIVWQKVRVCESGTTNQEFTEVWAEGTPDPENPGYYLPFTEEQYASYENWLIRVNEIIQAANTAAQISCDF